MIYYFVRASIFAYESKNTMHFIYSHKYNTNSAEDPSGHL